MSFEGRAILVRAMPVVLMTLFFVSSAWSRTREVVLYSFSGSDGLGPDAAVIRDKVGNLYGTTADGGAGFGTVFELRPNGAGGWTETVLYSFGGPANNDGQQPIDSLTFDRNGHIFGTTYFGGLDCNCGTVFELSPDGKGGWTETVIYRFGRNPDLNYPTSSVIVDHAGNLYGTAYYGGDFSNGGIYELKRSSSGWQKQILYSFSGGVDGANPFGGVVFRGRDTLFGTASQAGVYGGGTVYVLKRSHHGAWNQHVLYSLGKDKDAALPIGTPAFDECGRIYGTTYNGGTLNKGAIFRVSHINRAWKETFLHSFGEGNDGAYPLSNTLVTDSDGQVYGSTSAGGKFGFGVIFSFSILKNHSKETILHNFENQSDGGGPEAGLLLDHLGRLYGTAGTGGNGGGGVVFQIIP